MTSSRTYKSSRIKNTLKIKKKPSKLCWTFCPTNPFNKMRIILKIKLINRRFQKEKRNYSPKSFKIKEPEVSSHRTLRQQESTFDYSNTVRAA